MTRKQEQIHNGHVEDLVLQISDDYCMVSTHVEYEIGEIDVVGYTKNNELDFYEVKTSKTRGSMCKAISQLNRAREYTGADGKDFVYTPKRGIEPLERIVGQYK